LELDAGGVLPESVAILHYLEDRFPDKPCIPDEHVERAKMRVMISYADTHLAPELLPFLKALILPNFSFDEEAQSEVVLQTLDKFDKWLGKGDSTERNIHLGDISLSPTIWYTNFIMSNKLKRDPLEGLENVKAWHAMSNENLG
jgi:glutathione S-transferase